MSGRWDERFSIPGVDGFVTAITVDGDFVYVGGWFSVAGDTPANSIARWNRDSGEWLALGMGVRGEVTSIAVHEGTVYVGGRLTEAGGDTVRNLAVWDGGAWSSLGSPNGPIAALATDTKGNLYAGGEFTAIGDTTANYVACWDGARWSPLGTGVREGGTIGTEVEALAMHADTLYVGGRFQEAGTVEARNIARWDPDQEWTALGEGLTNPEGVLDGVYAIAVDDEGVVYAGGYVSEADGRPVQNIAWWDGTNWSAMGSGLGEKVTTIAVGDGGVVYANAYRWDGQKWLAPTGGSVNFAVFAMAVAGDGELYVGGERPHTPGGGNPINFLRRRTASGWSTLSCDVCHGVTGEVRVLAAHGDTIYAGGEIAFAGAMRAGGIARWNGTRWDTLGAGVDGVVRDIVVAEDGDVYVGGRFTRAGGVAARNVARWDGKQWHALGGGVGGDGLMVAPYVDALALHGSTLYVGGFFIEAGGAPARAVARWDRESQRWAPMGGGMNSQVLDFEIDAAGTLYAAGAFDEADGETARSVARWDGERWQAVGEGLRNQDHVAGMVYDLALWEEQVHAAGIFTRSGQQDVTYLAQWEADAAAWEPLGGPDAPDPLADELPLALHPAEEGLFVGGRFDHVKDADGTVRSIKGVGLWDGRQWYGVGGSVHRGYQVRALALAGDDLYVGGNIRSVRDEQAAPIVSLNFARYEDATRISTEELDSARETMSLHAAPNPFRTTTTVRYRLDRPCVVRLEVYDVLGRRVAVLARGAYPAGRHEAVFDGRGLSSGLYVVRGRMTSAGTAHSFMQKVMLVK